MIHSPTGSEWAAARGHVAASPVRLRTVRTRDGARAHVPELASTDVRSSNVKWLTPRAFRLWRDVGLRGYGADGRPDARTDANGPSVPIEMAHLFRS
jgi:hypothetical protein